ncbi:hypothetical protein GJAV_G00218340 [Gymnothorax javanicus]|nr:hypothetical protein GJAV_G00218340 [Gymnothorax javanicus]
MFRSLHSTCNDTYINPPRVSRDTALPYPSPESSAGQTHLKGSKMSIKSILSAGAIDSAIKDCQAPDTFCYKKFFQMCGLTQKSPQEVKEVFCVLDNDGSGYIEAEELKYFLQRFSSGARVLTDKEADAFMSAADGDNDGKIGVQEFQNLVSS